MAPLPVFLCNPSHAMPPTPSTALIIAFDGLVADTLPARALALSEAITAEWGPFGHEQAAALLPGRSMPEAVDAALAAFPDVASDHTLRDLATMRAQRRCTGAFAQGMPFAPAAIAWLTAQRERGTRLILRTDSTRRDVEPLLQLGALDLLFAAVRCADDLPRVPMITTLESSYRAIDARLSAMTPGAHRTAIEPSPEGVAVAANFVQTVYRAIP